jgi:hypothetical protein
MTDVEKAALKERVMIWQKAAPLLEAQRDADIRATDTAEAMRIFTGSADWAVKYRPALPSSGLVEQQRWFMKIFATL